MIFHEKKKGAILVFVLGLVVLLGALCIRLMEETVQELRHASQFHRQDDLRLHADSLLDITSGVLNEFLILDSRTLKTSGGWNNPLGWSGLLPFDPRIKWDVFWKNESGKLPLFEFIQKNPKVMKEIFACMYNGEFDRIDEDDGKPYYDALMDWQDADDNPRDEGAEEDYYQDLETPYFPANKEVQSFEEFRMIKGFGFDADDPEEDGLFFDKYGNETKNMKDFRETFSFYHSGKPNICVMGDFLCNYISGGDKRVLEEIMAYDPYSEGDLIIENSPIDFVKGDNETFLIELVVEKGKSRYKLHSVLTPAKGGKPKTIKGKVAPRSKQNKKLEYPVRLLRLRQNENI